MQKYVPGTKQSKWANPYLELDKYEEYVRKNSDLMNSITELEGKVLGCWCVPNPVGNISIKLLYKSYSKKIYSF